METTTIVINNWDKYRTKTKDIKNPWWFAFSNTFLEDPEMWSLDDAEKIAWIYVLSQASKQKKEAVFINYTHAEKACNIKSSKLKSAIDKLISFQIVTEIRPDHDQNPTGIRPNHGHHITREEKTLQEKRRDNINTQKSKKPSAFDADNISEVIEMLPDGKMDSLVKLYDNERQWIQRELVKIWTYYGIDNKNKKPKSVRGWSQAISRWLERGWSSRAANIKGTYKSREEKKTDKAKELIEKIERGEL